MSMLVRSHDLANPKSSESAVFLIGCEDRLPHESDCMAQPKIATVIIPEMHRLKKKCDREK